MRNSSPCWERYKVPCSYFDLLFPVTVALTQQGSTLKHVEDLFFVQMKVEGRRSPAWIEKLDVVSELLGTDELRNGSGAASVATPLVSMCLPRHFIHVHNIVESTSRCGRRLWLLLQFTHRRALHPK